MEPQKEDYKALYSSLKRKFSDLTEVKDQATVQLEQAKREIKKLSKEKKYLLDKLLQFESVSSDSDSDTDSKYSNNRYSSSSNNHNNHNNNNSKYNSQNLNNSYINTTFNSNTSFSSNIRDFNKSSNSNGNNSNNKKYKQDNDNNQQPQQQQFIEGICIGKDNKPCKGKAIPTSKYCWHHAPLDPNTDYVYCKFISSDKKNNKKCNIPILKSKSNPYCNYHQSKALADTIPPLSTTSTTNPSQLPSTTVQQIPIQQQNLPTTINQTQLPLSQNNTPPHSQQQQPQPQPQQQQQPQPQIQNSNSPTIIKFNIKSESIDIKGTDVITPTILSNTPTTIKIQNPNIQKVLSVNQDDVDINS